MKLNTKQFLAAVSECRRVIKSGVALQSLQSVLLKCDGGRLTVSTTNLDAWITRYIPCEGEITPLCVTAHKLAQVLSEIQSDDVEVTNDGARLKITAGDFRTFLQALDATEFLQVDIGKAKPIAVSTLDLADAIDATSWAAGDDPTRLNIQNILIRLTPTRLKAYATTAKTVAVFDRALICGKQDIIAPALLLEFVPSTLREEESEFSLSDSYCVAKSISGTVAVKRPETGFVSDEALHSILGVKDALRPTPVSAMALKRATVMAQVVVSANGYSELIIEHTGSELRFRATNGDYEETIACPGEKAWAKINPAYLAEALPKLAAETIEFRSPGPIMAGESKAVATYWSAGDLTVVISQLAAMPHEVGK